MRIRWLRAAEKSLDEIASYLAEDDLEAAARTVARIVDVIDLLAVHPAMGRPGRVVGTRELVVPDTPFIVPYRVRAKVVEILRVMHGARKWPTPL